MKIENYKTSIFIIFAAFSMRK